MKKFMLLMVLLSFVSYLTSCTPDDEAITDNQLENPTYSTGGDEIDDPAEPDEDD